MAASPRIAIYDDLQAAHRVSKRQKHVKAEDMLHEMMEPADGLLVRLTPVS